MLYRKYLLLLPALFLYTACTVTKSIPAYESNLPGQQVFIQCRDDGYSLTGIMKCLNTIPGIYEVFVYDETPGLLHIKAVFAFPWGKKEESFKQSLAEIAGIQKVIIKLKLFVTNPFYVTWGDALKGALPF